MGAAIDTLLGYQSAGNRFDIPWAEHAELRVAALDEAFQDRRHRIRLLAHRAGEAGIDRIARLADMVPLLFPHTAYKSYPESFLTERRWDRLSKWLSTVSPHPIASVDLATIDGIDDWIEQLEAHGHFISCSSGTTGKSGMLIASQKDMNWSRVDTVNVFAWGSGVEPRQDRMLIGCAPVATVPKNRIIGEAQYAAFANPAWPRWVYPVPPITVGALTQMVVMRKAIADGTARPDELARFQSTSDERQAVLDAAITLTADEIIANRGRKLMVAGLWSGLYAVARLVRDKGYSAKDFDPDNCIYVGGGLKRAQLPADYKQFVHETFNIPESRDFQNYSMQELNSGMPKCRQGNRYHIPPWVIPFVLDEAGETLLDMGKGEVEGRAAFFDLSLDGRWGGVISGDRVSIDFGPCSCGHRGPSVRDDIARYADLKGDDKIGCAGTVDAYVRGVS